MVGVHHAPYTNACDVWSSSGHKHASYTDPSSALCTSGCVLRAGHRFSSGFKWIQVVTTHINVKGSGGGRGAPLHPIPYTNACEVWSSSGHEHASYTDPSSALCRSGCVEHRRYPLCGSRTMFVVATAHNVKGEEQ